MCMCIRAKKTLSGCAGGHLARCFRLLLLFTTMTIIVVVHNRKDSIHRRKTHPGPIYTTLSIPKYEFDTPNIPPSDPKQGKNKPTQTTLNALINFFTKRWSEENSDYIVKTIVEPEILKFENDIIESPETSTDITNATTKKKRRRMLCASWPPYLGPIKVIVRQVDLQIAEKRYQEVKKGGQYAPWKCRARHKVAIIVPYRDRKNNLAIFLYHMHQFLINQNLDYGIFIIEQTGYMKFNRAKLFNVGFVESLKQRSDWQCFIFHDVDLLPLDGRNMYSCPPQPRHLSAAVNTFGFKLPYERLFGGASAMTREQFIKVNGFSNKYWGWGGEDDDMSQRLTKSNYSIIRHEITVARYIMLPHEPQKTRARLSGFAKHFQREGLNSLHYRLISVQQLHLYTHVLVNIDYGFIKS